MQSQGRATARTVAGLPGGKEGGGPVESPGQSGGNTWLKQRESQMGGRNSSIVRMWRLVATVTMDTGILR
jgi:hypothetical protein